EVRLVVQERGEWPLGSPLEIETHRFVSVAQEHRHPSPRELDERIEEERTDRFESRSRRFNGSRAPDRRSKTLHARTHQASCSAPAATPCVRPLFVARAHPFVAGGNTGEN